MTDEERLQKYLPLIRHAAGWTAEELGNKIGVTKQTISNLENQKSKMTKTQYLAIQMVISQKIATTTDDLTLVNVMKLVMDSDEEQIINYDAIPQALAVAEELDKENNASTKADKSRNPAHGVAVGAPLGSLAGLVGAIALPMPTIVRSTILGAAISPWLTKAVNDEKKEKK